VLKLWIESHVGLCLIAGMGLGLLFPFGAHIPSETVLALLAPITFLSFYKIDRSSLRDAFCFKAVIFCLARFAVLPVAIWFVAEQLLPSYALACMLLALLPAGVSSAAFASLFNGNVALAFVVTIVSSFTCVVLIPIATSLTASASVNVDVMGLFRALAFCLVLPACVFAVVGRKKALRKWENRVGRLTTVALLTCVVFIVLTKLRPQLLAAPQLILAPFLIATACYAIYIVVGFGPRVAAADRIAFGVCSTINNPAIGVSVAILYFDTRVVMCALAGEIIWLLTPFVVQPLTRRLLR